MSTFLITGAGHSGTAFLARELNRSARWQVEHEPDDSILLGRVLPRFFHQDYYGEVNSFLLTSAIRIPADRKGVLIRDPYDILRSIVRSGWGLMEAQFYVREAINQLDNLRYYGAVVVKFTEVTSDPSAVVRCAREMGIFDLDESQVDLSIENHHEGDDPEYEVDETTSTAFDQFNRMYGL